MCFLRLNTRFGEETKRSFFFFFGFRFFFFFIAKKRKRNGKSSTNLLFISPIKESLAALTGLCLLNPFTLKIPKYLFLLRKYMALHIFSFPIRNGFKSRSGADAKKRARTLFGARTLFCVIGGFLI